eukprot:gene13357-biopygen10668
MTFYCGQCDLDLTPVFGDSNLSEHEQQHEHEQCSIGNYQRRVTTNRRIEHEAKFHPIKCADCSSHFRSEANLKRHVARVHRVLERVLCSNSTTRRKGQGQGQGQQNEDVVVDGGREHGTVSDLRDAADVGEGARDGFDSVADLRRHNLVVHDRNDLWFCQPCSRMFATETNLKRHKDMAHRFVCVYCAKRFGSGKQLKSHIATDHNEHPCYFCGAQFTSEKQFKHFGKLGACSTSTEPSLRRFHTTWNELQYEHEPWEADCDVLLRGSGFVQNKVQQKTAALRRQQRADNDDDDDNDEQRLVDAVRVSVREDYIKRLQQEYMDNLKELVNRVVIDREDGEIRRITVNLVQKVPFEEQLERALREIFAAVRHQTPYKLVLAFGFMLYKRKTDELWTFYVNEHLTRDPVDRRFIHQLPNVWNVHDRRDEEKIIVELKEMDFFNALQSQLDQHGYDVIVIRITNVVAEVFPTVATAESYSNLLQAAVHDGDDETVLEGRGEEEDDDDDDAMDAMDNVFDQEVEEVEEVEAEEEEEKNNDDNNYVLNADRRKTRRKERDENGERIDAYVKRCSTKRSTILYGRRVKNFRRNEDVLPKLCFFIQMAFWHLRAEKKKKPNERNGAEIEKRAQDYFRLYCGEFEIDNDEEFTGVNVKIVDNLEYLFKTRVNMFVCTALERVLDDETRRYVTFDFEALLKNVKQSQLDAWDARVGDDVKKHIIANDDDNDDDDDNGENVLVNIPLSYAIATNFPCCDDDDEDDDTTPNVFEREYDAEQQQQQQWKDDDDDESMYCERSGDGGKYFSLFRVARSPR